MQSNEKESSGTLGKGKHMSHEDEPSDPDLGDDFENKLQVAGEDEEMESEEDSVE